MWIWTFRGELARNGVEGCDGGVWWPASSAEEVETHTTTPTHSDMMTSGSTLYDLQSIFCGSCPYVDALSRTRASTASSTTGLVSSAISPSESRARISAEYFSRFACAVKQ